MSVADVAAKHGYKNLYPNQSKLGTTYYLGDNKEHNIFHHDEGWIHSNDDDSIKEGSSPEELDQHLMDYHK